VRTSPGAPFSLAYDGGARLSILAEVGAAEGVVRARGLPATGSSLAGGVVVVHDDEQDFVRIDGVERFDRDWRGGGRRSGLRLV
jgi:hypothetical protein